ncbi:MAG TPA: hypothetical protein VGI40_19470 [Pirellulaceae bacterium]|jgi:predicted transcriptional regulator
MVAINLDQAHLDRLDLLAKSQGQQATDLARRIIVDFLDLESLPADTDEDWAEASVQLAPEVMGDDSWDDHSHGP